PSWNGPAGAGRRAEIPPALSEPDPGPVSRRAYLRTHGGRAARRGVAEARPGDGPGQRGGMADAGARLLRDVSFLAHGGCAPLVREGAPGWSGAMGDELMARARAGGSETI